MRPVMERSVFALHTLIRLWRCAEKSSVCFTSIPGAERLFAGTTVNR